MLGVAATRLNHGGTKDWCSLSKDCNFDKYLVAQLDDVIYINTRTVEGYRGRRLAYLQ